MLECRTERLLVRELRPEDRAEYVRLFETGRDHFAPWFPEATPEERFERELAKLEERRARGSCLRTAGVAADGRIVGLFHLSEIVRGAFQSAFASWAVGAEHVRRGYGTEGVRALLDLAFSRSSGLGLHRVQANVIPENVASLSLARRAGFREEGLARRYLRIAGAWRDHVMFAVTAEEHRFAYLPPGPEEETP